MATEPKRLYRSRKERMIAGVCGGLADYFGIDPTLVRLFFVIAALAGGPGLLAYIIMMLVVPEVPEQPETVVPPESTEQN